MGRMLLNNNVDDDDRGVNDAIYLRLYHTPSVLL